MNFLKNIFRKENYKSNAHKGTIYPKDKNELKILVNKPEINLADIVIPSHIIDFSTLFHSSKRTDFSGLETWDVSRIRNMRNMFRNCKAFTGKEIEDWDVSNVDEIWGMFRECDNFDADLSLWEFSRYLYDVSDMFAFCKKFTGRGLENWDVSKIKNTNHMFYRCDNFVGKVESWDVSSVELMFDMFHGCKKFNGDLSQWNLSSLRRGSSIFLNSDIRNIPKNFREKFKYLSLIETGCNDTPEKYYGR